MKKIVILLFSLFVIGIAVDAKVTTIFKPNAVGISAPVLDGDSSHYFNGIGNFADPFAACTLDYMPVWNASVKQMQNSSFRQLGGRQWQLEGNGGSNKGKLWLYDLFVTNQVDAATVNATTVNTTTLNTTNLYTSTINGTTIIFNGGGGNVSQGTYIPTVACLLNCDLNGVSTFDAMWTRVGNVITVDGRVDVDPFGVGITNFRISLPIGTDLTYEYQLTGVLTHRATGADGEFNGIILADSLNNDATVSVWASGAGAVANGQYVFHFSYVTTY